MPVINTLVWLVIHSLIAIGINIVGKWFNLVNYGELFSLYFVVVAARLYLAQVKFSTAYQEDPELVEQILRNELLNEDNQI